MTTSQNKVGLPDNKMMGLAMLHLYLAPFLVTLPRLILLENEHLSVAVKRLMTS